MLASIHIHCIPKYAPSKGHQYPSPDSSRVWLDPTQEIAAKCYIRPQYIDLDQTIPRSLSKSIAIVLVVVILEARAASKVRHLGKPSTQQGQWPLIVFSFIRVSLALLLGWMSGLVYTFASRCLKWHISRLPWIQSTVCCHLVPMAMGDG